MVVIARLAICTVLIITLSFITSPQLISASHSVTASPAGGAYAIPQSVSLQTIEFGEIHYSTDGTEPTLNSTLYDGNPISIVTNTTLKFFAVDIVGNHTSETFTEYYSVLPIVVSTAPSNGDSGVNISSVINATFSESMDVNTINNDSFFVTDEFGNSISGFITYSSNTNTASFAPDSQTTPLSPVIKYIVTLTSSISDETGNSLVSDFTWNFTTGGEIQLFVNDESFNPIAGSGFTFTPNPFTLEGSLEVRDNDENDTDSEVFGGQTDGIIVLRNVGITTYAMEQTIVPDGYSKLYDHMIVTVHPTSPIATFVVQNLATNVDIGSLTQFIDVPPPYLNATQFTEIYSGNAIVAIYQGIPGEFPDNFSEISSVGPNSIQAGRLLTLNTLSQATDPPLQSAIFVHLAASSSSSGADIIDDFDIPTYPHPEESIANQVIYSVPAFVIPYEESLNNFVATPIISKIFPGLTIRMDQASFVGSELAKVEHVNMTFNAAGNNVGFIFGISDSPPPGTPSPPLDVPALFLDVGFVGDVDFSKSAAFQSSPNIDILVNKTLPGFPELPNGCPDFRLLFFNGNNWEEVQKLNPTGNFTDSCPFTLEPEHFSKFAVGGVKGQTVVTEEHKTHSGGGPSRSTAITQTPSGSDVETAIRTQSGTVNVHFETVEEGSGQLKVNANELSVFEQYFDELAFLSQDSREHGMVNLEGATYATAGDVFDIDASLVKFEGAVEVTIPYDEDTVTHFGSESNIRFIHYDSTMGAWEDRTTSVDEAANTVTGTLESLSPVSAAIILGGGGISADNPMLRAKLAASSLSISDGGQVILSTRLENTQSINQDYVLLVQVVDENNVAQHIDWQKGSIAGNQHSEISISWNEMQHGKYRVQVLLLTDLENPWLLAEPVKEQLNI